jgi:hypothetical protein
VKIGAKHRKLIIAGVGILAALALGYVLYSQRPDGAGLGNSVEDKKNMLSKYMEIIDREGPYEVDLQQFKDRLQQDRNRLLEGENANVAESELMKVVTDFAEKDGVQITQKIVQKEEKIKEQLYKVSARIVADCDSDAFVQFLVDIRNYNKFLTIDEFTVQTRTSRTQTVSTIRPTLTVSGYLAIPGTGMGEEAPGAKI